MELLCQLSLLWATISVASWMVPTAGNKAIPSTPGPKQEAEAPQPCSQPPCTQETEKKRGPRAMPVTPTPPAPRLSLFPPYSIFARGEKIELQCSPPARRRAVEFLFYKQKPNNQWALQIQQNQSLWEVSTDHLEAENTFTCTYTEEDSARERLQSVLSNHRKASVIESPPAVLSLDPKHAVYLRGERVTLTCSASHGETVAGYKFYKEQHGQTRRELPHKGQGPYETFRLDQRTAGKYSCVYWMSHSGREIESPRSSLVSVAMTETPRPPVFSVSPKQEVYRSGECIVLGCVAPDRRQVSKITFLKDGQQLRVLQLQYYLDSTQCTLCLLPQDGGRYFCTYHTVESGRELRSPRSNGISISVLALMSPEPSTSVPPAQTYETITRVPVSPGALTSSSSPYPSSQRNTEENLHSTEPDGPVTSKPSASQSTLHDTSTSSASPQGSTKPFASHSSTKPLDSHSSTKRFNSEGSTKPLGSWGSTKPFTSNRDPRSTSQTKAVSTAQNGNHSIPTDRFLHLALVVACTGTGVLFLLFLVYLFRKKLKGDRRKPSRSFWNTLEGPQTWTSRISLRRGTQRDLQGKAKPRWSQEVSQDWGILPKFKPAAPSKCRNPAKQNGMDDRADSGAESEFPETVSIYTLRGYPCSTFFEAESDTQDTKIYQEIL